MDTDETWLDRLLAQAPAPVPSAALERRVLADFDRLAARRDWAGMLRALIDSVWPGAPVWQPAVAFALSLVIGLGAAAFAPLGGSASDDNGAVLYAYDAPIDIVPQDM